MTNYTGIDYSLGKSNFDPDNGIHFGCISQNEVLQAWCDSSEPEYIYCCPYCDHEHAESFIQRLGNEVQYSFCRNSKCKHKLTSEDFQEIEPIGFNIDDGEYKAFSDDTGDIMIIKSPYYTYAQYCSPCAPGAGYLMNWFKPDYPLNKASKEDIPYSWGIEYNRQAEAAGFPKVYCFGHEWFDNGTAPYPVFSVETGELVKADK